MMFLSKCLEVCIMLKVLIILKIKKIHVQNLLRIPGNPVLE